VGSRRSHTAQSGPSPGPSGRSCRDVLPGGPAVSCEADIMPPMHGARDPRSPQEGPPNACPWPRSAAHLHRPERPVPTVRAQLELRHAGRHPVTFTQLQVVTATGRRPWSEQAAVLECAGCRQCTVVIERAVSGSEPPTRYEGVHWWPAPGPGDLDPEVPEEVGSAFAEGMRALRANCPRAAVVMLRGMLAAVVCDQAARTPAGCPPSTASARPWNRRAPYTRAWWSGRPRSAWSATPALEELEPVEQAEAADLARLCRHLITVVYKTPARIRRARLQPSS
jgi:hypothetical protein